ncbi:MAG: hypothetical protein ACLQGP_39740 [Isosphaeraceae bacterium]
MPAAWRHRNPFPMDIPATLGRDRRIRYVVWEAMRDVLEPDKAQWPSVSGPTSRRRTIPRAMTRDDPMPVLIEEPI